MNVTTPVGAILSPGRWRASTSAPTSSLPPRNAGRGLRTGLLTLTVVLLIAVAGCSPEDGRTRGQLGADIGNTALPIQMHGNRDRNNPSFAVPDVGQVPRDGRGVPGWWAR
jgi:hypothetical protein